MRRETALILPTLLILNLCLSSMKCDIAFAAEGRVEWQKGICYMTWDKNRYSTKESDDSLKALANTGAEWVAISVTWYQEKVYTTNIFPTQDTPTDESLIHAIQFARSLGKKVMLKPHIDIHKVEGGAWRGEISYPTDAEWDDWFKNYSDFILHYAKIAQDNKVELFCIGTELTSVATTKEKMWREKVIAPTKELYKGPLTYAANWNEEYRYIKFWDALDYVGIDAYFPLSGKESPDLDEIKKGWEKWVADLEDFQAKVAKPIIFPEVGYCSADGAARTPWQELINSRLNLELQANCYEALFGTFWDKSWFYGVYWWKWGTDVRFGGHTNKGFTPQNKPAEEVIKRWYKKPVPERDPAIFKKTI